MDGEWASPWADDVDSHHPPPPPPPPPAPLTSDSVLPLSKPSSKLDDDPWGAFTDSAAWADAGDEGEASFDGPAEAEGKKNDGTETFAGWGQELGLELGDSKINASEEVKTNGHDVNRFSTLGMAQIEDWGWGSLEVGDVDEGRKMDEVPSLSATAAGEKVENIGSGDDWGWSDAVSDRPNEEKIKGTLEQISGSEEKEKITNSEGWGVDTEDANPASTGPAQESLDTTSTVTLAPSRTTNEAEKSSPSPEPPADELALDSPKDEVTDNEAEEEPDKPVTSEEVSDKDREEMTDKSTTPAPEALGITANMPPDGDAEDDDFGDFVSEPEELEGTDANEPAKPPDSTTPLSPTSPTSPRSHAFHTAPLDTVKADLSLVSKLYPVPTSYPAPPPLEHSVISSTEARRTWYRLTQAGSLRMSNLADASDYVQVSWSSSKVREQVIDIITKWAAEDRTMSRNTRARMGRSNSSSPASAFGWGEPLPGPEQKRHSFGIEPAKRSPLTTQTHSRNASDIGVVTSKLEKPKKESLISPLESPTPQGAKFEWGSLDNLGTPKSSLPNTTQASATTPSFANLAGPQKQPGSPLKIDIMAPLSPTPSSKAAHSTPATPAFPPPSSKINSSAPSPRTSDVASAQASPTFSQTASSKTELTQPTTQITSSKTTLSNGAITKEASSVPASTTKEASSAPVATEIDPWAAFDTPQKSSQPAPATASTTDAWDMFDSLVSKTAVIPSKSGSVVVDSAFQKPKTTKVPPSNIPSISQSSAKKASPPEIPAVLPVPTTKVTRPRTESIPTTFTEILASNPEPISQPHRPLTPYSITSTPRDEDPPAVTEDADDEWGEMVEPGSSFSEDPIPVASFAARPTSMFLSPGPSLAPGTSPPSYFSSTNGLSRSNTLPSRPKQQPTLPATAGTATAGASTASLQALGGFSWSTPPLPPQQPMKPTHGSSLSFSFSSSPAATSMAPTPSLVASTPLSNVTASITTTASTNATDLSSGWDLSFFDRPSSTPAYSASRSHPATPSTAFPPFVTATAAKTGQASSSLADLWDTPAIPQRSQQQQQRQQQKPQVQPAAGTGSGSGSNLASSTIGKSMSEDDRMVQEIVKSLPDLSYMLL